MTPILAIDAPLRPGSTGQAVKEAQEWLSLRCGRPWPFDVTNELLCPISGTYDEATATAVKMLQAALDEPRTGVLEVHQFAQLALGLKRAQSEAMRRDTFGATVLAILDVMLKVQPREIGGQNRGPWVRYFCRGYEVSWCAGFACTVYEQAAALCGISLPFARELACDLLARDARNAGTFLPGVAKGPPARLKAGDLFLVRATPGNPEHKEFHHTGIVTEPLPDRCFTVEGNTNEGGSPNGYGVFPRARGYAGLDFISITV